MPFDAKGVLGRICVKRLYAYRCGTWAKDKGSSERVHKPPLEKIRAEGKFARRSRRKKTKKRRIEQKVKERGRRKGRER